jgi:hypothetical protein
MSTTRPPSARAHRAALGLRLAALSLLVAGCRQQPEPPARGSVPVQPPPQFFDFGTIDHGKAKEHDFVLDPIAVLGPGYYPAGTHVDCSCARTLLLLRDQDGNERPVESYNPASAPKPGELLVVRTQVDTVHKEPVDRGPTDSRLLVVFQPTTARDASARVTWPLNFRFAIDSPVRLRPYSVLDFERVPESQSAELLTTMTSDLPGRPIRFGPARCEDDRLQLSLEQRDDITFLHARLTPRAGEYGAFRLLVTIDTDLESGYRINLAAVGRIVPDLEAVPMAKLSLRADLRREQTAENAQSQYLLVTDHNTSRPAEFVVSSLVDADGKDARNCFDVTFEPVQGDPRTHRMRLRWIGQADSEFRGEIVLAKDPSEGPFLPIEVVALHVPQR